MSKNACEDLPSGLAAFIAENFPKKQIDAERWAQHITGRWWEGDLPIISTEKKEKKKGIYKQRNRDDPFSSSSCIYPPSCPHKILYFFWVVVINTRVIKIAHVYLICIWILLWIQVKKDTIIFLVIDEDCSLASVHSFLENENGIIIKQDNKKICI